MRALVCALRLLVATWLSSQIIAADNPARLVLRNRIVLTGSIREPGDILKLRGHFIRSMCFSHRGTKIALLAVGHYYGTGGLVHLIIVDLAKPQPAINVFDISTIKLVSYAGQRLAWSTDDKLVLLHNRATDAILFDLMNGTPRCSIQSTYEDSGLILVSGFPIRLFGGFSHRSSSI